LLQFVSCPLALPRADTAATPSAASSGSSSTTTKLFLSNSRRMEPPMLSNQIKGFAFPRSTRHKWTQRCAKLTITSTKSRTCSKMRAKNAHSLNGQPRKDCDLTFETQAVRTDRLAAECFCCDRSAGTKLQRTSGGYLTMRQGAYPVRRKNRNEALQRVRERTRRRAARRSRRTLGGKGARCESYWR
jgi:hypothetical protein